VTLRRILWSGGFDSTFLVLDALTRGERVEPFYVQQATEPVWQKQRRECAALESIVSRLPRGYRARLTKLPRAPFIVYRDVWGEYRKLDKELRQIAGDDYSPQLPLLAAVAHELHGVEMAFVAGDSSIQHEASRLFMAAHQIESPLAGKHKGELLRDADHRGFGHLLRLTWSCEGDALAAEHGPCGECGPCKARIIPQSIPAGVS
jgi:hypothetical protein